jgi:hypothetical protein
MGRYKALVGPRPRARGFEAQQTEAAISVAILNRMLAAGHARTLPNASGSLRNSAGLESPPPPSAKCTNAVARDQRADPEEDVFVVTHDEVGRHVHR